MTMSKSPPVHELQFLKLFANHAELSNRLLLLGCPTSDIQQFAMHVCEAWFHLGEEHLAEAKKLLAAGCLRATYSRAYYAAYNASKGARYLVKGIVSLKGDDHGKASSDLPDDFPNVATWGMKVSVLYENRLRADYENWSTTTKEFTINPDDAVADAEAFVAETRVYLNGKFGMSL